MLQTFNACDLTWYVYGSEFWTMYNWPFSDLEHFYYTWFAPSYSETISLGVIIKSAIRAFRKHILYIPLLVFVHHTGLQMQKMTLTFFICDVFYTLVSFGMSWNLYHKTRFSRGLHYLILIVSYSVFGAHRGMLSIKKAMEALPLVTFYIHVGPPPQPATPRRGHWGHPGNCHEQSLFFT